MVTIMVVYLYVPNQSDFITVVPLLLNDRARF